MGWLGGKEGEVARDSATLVGKSRVRPRCAANESVEFSETKVSNNTANKLNHCRNESLNRYKFKKKESFLVLSPRINRDIKNSNFLSM